MSGSSGMRHAEAPVSVRLRLYLVPHKVPESWRSWASEEIRTRAWGLRSAVWTALVVPGLFLALPAAGFVLSRFSGLAALVSVGLLLLWLGGLFVAALVTTGIRRRWTLSALEGRHIHNVWSVIVLVGMLLYVILRFQVAG
jgi:hypothetical protein